MLPEDEICPQNILLIIKLIKIYDAGEYFFLNKFY